MVISWLAISTVVARWSMSMTQAMAHVSYVLPIQHPFRISSSPKEVLPSMASHSPLWMMNPDHVSHIFLCGWFPLPSRSPICACSNQVMLSTWNLIFLQNMLTNVHPNIFSWPVIYGKKLGRQLGFPTANVFLGNGNKPSPGTYGCICLLGTFASLRDDDVIMMGKKRATGRIEGLACFREGTDILEVHLLDRSGNLYDQTITVSLVSFLRPNRSFSSLDHLTAQLLIDRQTWHDTRRVGMNFGTFDYLHHGHLRYCACASLMSKELITIVSHDTHRKPDTQQSMDARIFMLTQWSIPYHTVIGGDPHDYLAHPHHYRPSIFFLGYDQIQGMDHLRHYRHDADVCIVDAYEPHRFKSSLLKK